MSWHKLILKVSDVLALLGQRCLGTHQLMAKLAGQVQSCLLAAAMDKRSLIGISCDWHLLSDQAMCL